MANGNVLLLCLAELPHEIASRVRGGQAGSEHECKMHADYLVEMTIDGRVVWEWRSWEHLAPETDCIVNPQDTRRAWTHGNGVAKLPDGNFVVSFRLISTVIIIERRTGEVIRKLGPPALNNQHAPTPLPNGNTLICEGVFGRLFEVTHAGEVVWEYISPYFGNDPQRGPTNSIFRPIDSLPAGHAGELTGAEAQPARLQSGRGMHVEIVTQLGSEVLPQVRALLDVARRRDGVESIGEHKFLRVSSGTNASGVKAILGYDGERLVGYANVEMFPIKSPTRTASGCRLSAEMVVHPEARRQGTASAMLEAIVKEARSQDLDRVDIWAYHQLSGTRELAAKFGFEPSRTLLEIRMRLPDSFPEAPLPPGVELRGFRQGQDESEWLALNNLVFDSHPEQGAWDDEDLAVRLRQPWFDAQDFLVATKDGRLVAYNWLKLDRVASRGEIYVIGVHPDERRRHFGRSLTILGLEHMVRRDMKDASAYVDASNSGALALYYSLGFGLDHSDLCYSKPLKDAQPA